MMHKGLHVDVWLQSNSERSKPHVNVTQVIKVTSLQKIRVCHWGFFHAVLVEYLSISCNHNTTSSFALFSFAWIFFLTEMRERRGWGCLCAVISWSASVGCCSSLCYSPSPPPHTSASPLNPVIPHCFSADSGCREGCSSNWRPV